MVMRWRIVVGMGLIAFVAAIAGAERAWAIAEVHRFNLVLSVNPTAVNPTDFNDRLDSFNHVILLPRDLKGMDKIHFGWLYDAQLHYFVRPNIAVLMGVGQLRSQTKREFLPAIQQDIQLRAEVLSVPVQVGGAYYLQPYNQGDFQARVYLGAGFMSLVYNRARLQAAEAGTDPSTTLGGSYNIDAKQDSPGFYAETGVHMFFASRISVMVGALYRSAKIRNMVVETRDHPPFSIQSFDLDTSGLGLRMGVGIGL